MRISGSKEPSVRDKKANVSPKALYYLSGRMRGVELSE